MSRTNGPVSGVSLAFLNASWNFLSNNSDRCFSASTDWRKIDSLRVSCSRIDCAAPSRSANILGFTGATCEMTAPIPGSIFITAPQHGHPTSNASALPLFLDIAVFYACLAIVLLQTQELVIGAVFGCIHEFFQQFPAVPCDE